MSVRVSIGIYFRNYTRSRWFLGKERFSLDQGFGSILGSKKKERFLIQLKNSGRM